MTELTKAGQDKIAVDVRQDIDKADKLTKAYNTDPELWRSHNLAVLVARTVSHSGFKELTSQAVADANYDGKVRELTRPQDTPLERSLVELVALNWVRLQLVQLHYPEQGSITLCDYWDRHLAAVEWRFLKACETLAKVRRLALPVLQLNIGHKQMNVAQVNNKG